MSDSKKKWLGLAAVGATVAAFIARISRRGDRKAAPQDEATPPEAES
jgi:hypothetical protein